MGNIALLRFGFLSMVGAYMRVRKHLSEGVGIRRRAIAALLLPIGLGLMIWLLPVQADHDDPPAEPLPADVQPEDLAKRAFELVEHQVRAATTQEDTSWASQPGAIRTFNMDGSMSRIYKLYSAPDLLAGSTAEAQADLVVDWDLKPAQFVDLNAPQFDDNGDHTFPIADPRAEPEGFSFTSTINGVRGQIFREESRRLPMPVQWIYLLQDGTRGYLDADNRFIGSVVPTKANPIVGRIAYWADDNTAKVNLNTASEGVYWDMPRTDTVEDRGLSRSQPAAGEYQRHPGHPATVCLSSVLFPGKRIGTPEGGSGEMDPLPLSEADLLWKIGNGVGGGGSRAGTVPVADVMPATPSPLLYTPYDSVEDVFQKLQRHGINAPEEVETRAARSGFFLTTRSNSSELTLNGYPRVSTWPSDRTIDDPQNIGFDLISMPRGQRFSFERRSTSSRHGDFYTLGDNAALYAYLQVATRGQIPGFGASIADKYGSGGVSDSDQILAMAFDHVRGINLGGSGQRFSDDGQISSICMCGGPVAHRSRWHRPEFADPFGGGRTFTISEVALVFYCDGHSFGNGGGGFGDFVDLNAGEKRIKIAIVVEAFCPAHGSTYISPEMGVALSGEASRLTPLPTLHINGEPIVSISNPRLMVASPQASPGGHGGADLFLADTDGRGTIWSGEVIIPETHTSMIFSGNRDPINLIVYDSTALPNENNVVQVIPLKFPDSLFSIPVPRVDPIGPYDWNQRLARVSENNELIHNGDVVRSLVVGHGDYRLVAGTRAIEERVFQPHPEYDSSSRHGHSLLHSSGDEERGASFEGELVPRSNKPAHLVADIPFATDEREYAPRLELRDYPFPIDPALTGDFDNGYGAQRDGPYLNRPDEGVILDGGADQYFDDNSKSLSLDSSTLFAPHRSMPGPVAFGSIPSGVRAGVPWRTLLFRPDPQHFGASATPDHLWLDLFRMPAPLPHRDGVSRTGIGDWFSADGKINLNYQILPFNHIRRATALHAVLKSEKIMAIPTRDGETYKSIGGAETYRHFIDPNFTLSQWENKFDQGEVFRSATEICEMYLAPEDFFVGFPEGGDYPRMRQFWDLHKLTGDNTKERPYAALYQHFTTRSNSYDIHVLAQTIVKSDASPADLFDSAIDQVGAEYRGVGVLTRSIDVNCPTIPDYVDNPLEGPLTRFYQYDIDSELTPELQFEITKIELAPNSNPVVTWRSRAGQQFVIERSLDLAEWEFIANVAAEAAEATLTTFEDNTPPADVERVFYRILKCNN